MEPVPEGSPRRYQIKQTGCKHLVQRSEKRSSIRLDYTDRNGFSGTRRTIDVSADDRYNAGSAPSYARDIALAKGITINGLAIDSTGELTRYFRRDVIGGPDAFVITAQYYASFNVALKKKLLRELTGQGPLAAGQSNGQVTEAKVMSL